MHRAGMSKAHSTQGEAAEARGLWWLVDRPNLFIKIPATEAALPAISASLEDGISERDAIFLDRTIQSSARIRSVRT
jgi:hypothetical protein